MRKIIVLLLIFAIIFSIAEVEENFAATLQKCVISVTPKESVSDVDEYFTINITVANVWNLSIWKFDLSYDADVLYTNETMIVVDPDEWFSQDGSIQDSPRVRVTPGNITVGDLLHEDAGTSDNGTLAKVTFRVKDQGNSALDLHDTMLYDPYFTTIHHTLEDGVFHTPLPIIRVDRATNVHNPGEQFTINISIANVTNLNMWEARLTWKGSILKCPHATEGPFLQEVGGTSFWVKITPFELEVGSSVMGLIGANGSGTLAEIQFQVLSPGECDLDLCNPPKANDTLLYDPDTPPNLIPHETKDGVFHTTIPVASFTYSPQYPLPTEAVTFKAFNSYDPDGGAIREYLWDFGDGNTENSSYPEVTNIYGEFGNWTVCLTVIDDENETNSICAPEYPFPRKIEINRDVAIESVGRDPHFWQQLNITRPRGSVVNITVVITNHGTQNEYFTVTLHYNATAFGNWVPIGDVPVTNFTRKSTNNEDPLIFSWDTSGIPPGNYTFLAVASFVPGEKDTKNNWSPQDQNPRTGVNDAIVEVSEVKAGDVDGDGDVDSADLFAFAPAYGTEEGDPLYSSNCDFDDDGDVDSMDLFTLAENYGEDC